MKASWRKGVSKAEERDRDTPISGSFYWNSGIPVEQEEQNYTSQRGVGHQKNMTQNV